ncbi:MAG: hypothetical protein KAQ96_11495 [Thermoplasmata archaeon]|nr:hypothetical protein [Thermoplasmata archaeon]
MATAAAGALGPDRPSSTTEEEWVPSAVLQGEGVEPKITPYYLRTLTGSAPDSGLLSPAALNETDALAETTVNGPVAPRLLINNVGTYSMYVERMPLYIYGVNMVSLWAKSNEDVQGASFRVHLQRNGQNQRSMSTPPTQLSSAPMELTVSDAVGSFPEPLVIMPGDSMGLFIQYTARSRYPVGPAPPAIMLSSTMQHATRIELLASPMEMNVSAPAFTEGHLHVTGRVTDTSDLDPKEKLIFGLEITTAGGRLVKASQITQESFAPDEEKVLINWSWDYKKAPEATDGLYEFKIDVSYGVYGINYTNSSFYEVTFPEQKKEADGLFTDFNTTFLAVAIIIAVIVAVVAVVFWRRSRAAYPMGYMDPRGPPKRPKKAKKPKMSKKQKKAMMQTRNGMPPPGGPPQSPDRTPMPGRAPPGGGAPPPKAPGAPHGSPHPGTARPRR